MKSSFFRKAIKKALSERGSVFLEYAMITSLVLIVAIGVFKPGNSIYKNIGRDYRFRSIIMKLPVF